MDTNGGYLVKSILKNAPLSQKFHPYRWEQIESVHLRFLISLFARKQKKWIIEGKILG